MGTSIRRSPGRPAPFHLGTDDRRRRRSRRAHRSARSKLFDFTSGGGVDDLSGPAVTVTLRITNGGISGLDLSNVSVAVQDATGSPASPLLGTDAVPFAGSLRPQGSAVGSYSFSLPKQSRNPIRILISCSAAAPTAVFVGGAS